MMFMYLVSMDQVTCIRCNISQTFVEKTSHKIL